MFAMRLHKKYIITMTFVTVAIRMPQKNTELIVFSVIVATRIPENAHNYCAHTITVLLATFAIQIRNKNVKLFRFL